MSRPKKMADVLSELLTRRGYARQQASVNFSAAWCKAAGEALAAHSRVGAIRRGVLEIVVANSALAQELTFQKRSIIEQLAHLLPEERIADLRCRVGPIE